MFLGISIGAVPEKGYDGRCCFCKCRHKKIKIASCFLPCYFSPLSLSLSLFTSVHISTPLFSWPTLLLLLFLLFPNQTIGPSRNVYPGASALDRLSNQFFAALLVGFIASLSNSRVDRQADQPNQIMTVSQLIIFNVHVFCCFYMLKKICFQCHWGWDGERTMHAGLGFSHFIHCLH